MYLVGRRNMCWECDGQYLYGPFESQLECENFIEHIQNWWEKDWYVIPLKPIKAPTEMIDDWEDISEHSITMEDGWPYRGSFCELRRSQKETEQQAERPEDGRQQEE